MHIDQAIRTRRSIHRFKPDPVPRQVIEEILELAVWAPNHRLAEPWRFFVLTGAAREPLAAIHRELVREEAPEHPERAERRYRELLEVPAFLLVTYARDPDPRKDRENFAAVCCAIQNLMLAAHARGLGTRWRTGNVIRDRRTRALIGLGDEEEIAALIHLGYPAETPTSRRTPAAMKTVFLGG